ncbi:hypothetical protein [Litchfieldia alkalitelluris]|uniref:hypothetical protein n=1 Tax=Litchfieldia alkalitelluris TaxID=304268 RepID=UPI0009971818|nr:hypothetical protein [Litchfieldia alkalitelluris]
MFNGQQGNQFSQGGFQGNGTFQNQGNQGQFSTPIGGGSHMMMQPGFAGTNAQEVSRQNAQSAGSGSNVQGGFQGNGFNQSNFQNQGQFSTPISGGSHMMMQHGFAGTNAQEVSRQNAQSTGSGSNVQGGFQGNGFGGANFQSQGQFSTPIGGGAQMMMQPGFAGTNAQEVSRQNAQSAGSGSNVHGGFQGNGQGASFQNQGQFSAPMGGGAQMMMQPGFAGTNAQEVSQQNAQSSQGGSNVQGGYQAQNGFQQQNGFVGQQFSGGDQAMFQPGFAGTNAQNVAQQNSQSAHSGMNVQGGFGNFGSQNF